MNIMIGNSLQGALFAVSFISCLLTTMALMGFAVKYRRQGKGARSASGNHSQAAELFWSVVPVLIFLTVFAWGFGVFKDQHRVIPESQVRVQN